MLKTPTESTWKGVSNLKDYKVTFPRWTNYNLREQVSNMCDEGYDLLQKMLIYDPSQRISAKGIKAHPYLLDIKPNVIPDIQGIQF